MKKNLNADSERITGTQSAPSQEAIHTTIEIDCDPWTGMGRQGDHFKTICKNILKCDYYEPVSKFFGCWTWEVTYANKEQQDAVAEFLRELYGMGLCRYASW